MIVSQDDDFEKVFSKPNTTYIIKNDINLGGCKVLIGDCCTLIFRGGSLANGTLVGNNTRVKARNYEIFKRGYVRYRAYFPSNASKNDPPSLIKKYHDYLVIKGSWCNKKCGSNWTGLQKQSSEDVMLAVKNYVTLHKKGAKVLFPSINAFGYESIKLSGEHVLDFNNSVISYPENLGVWEDLSVSVPEGATASSLESGYGLLSISSNTTVKNLSLDGKSTYRQNECIRFGVSCIVSIGDARNVTFDNVGIKNVLGPAVTVQSKAKDITFKNCYFNNIGEHILYSHQYLGYCHFIGCTFDTWDSDRLSEFRDGLDYLYQHTPPVDEPGYSFEEAYKFDLMFKDCTFINPKRINSQGRTLGGFFTGSCPVIIKLDGCKFRGAYPPVNPGGGSRLSEKSGKSTTLIVRNCDGAPYIYPSKANYNIVTEFYDCVNIPFCVVYARRYENCNLTLDFYENNIENVSLSFEHEFSEPLVVKRCQLIDYGSNTIVYHPINHRPVRFEDCIFSGTTCHKAPSVVNTEKRRIASVVYADCIIDLPNYKLVSGSSIVDTVLIRGCRFEAIDSSFISTETNKVAFERNVVAKRLQLRTE